VHDDDSKFDAFLREAARDYKSAPSPRAEETWAAIESEVATAISAGRWSVARMRPWLPVGVGIAAALVIGVGIGRFSYRQPVGQLAVTAHVTSPSIGGSDSVRARYAAIEHLSDAEVFLTSVRADLRTGRSETGQGARSRELLSRTRILLGASNTTPEVRRLLEDLELLLAEISALPPQRSSMDQKILDESMREGNIIPRIRATLPASQAGA
jgi:hypothetical protein